MEGGAISISKKKTVEVRKKRNGRLAGIIKNSCTGITLCRLNEAELRGLAGQLPSLMLDAKDAATPRRPLLVPTSTPAAAPRTKSVRKVLFEQAEATSPWWPEAYGPNNAVQQETGMSRSVKGLMAAAVASSSADTLPTEDEQPPVPTADQQHQQIDLPEPTTTDQKQPIIEICSSPADDCERIDQDLDIAYVFSDDAGWEEIDSSIMKLLEQQ